MDRIKAKIRDARRQLHRIERANQGDKKSALRILSEAYGRIGKVRHGLLNPLVNAYHPSDMKYPSPLVPRVPHTAPPPPLSPVLCAIILQETKKKIEPELPVPKYKPLHRGRQANLLWRHRSLLLNIVPVSLPYEIVCELEIKAGASPHHPLHLGTLMRGGPLWNQFYAPLNIDYIQHLSPNRIPLPRSTFTRTLWAESPYKIIQKKDPLEYYEDRVSMRERREYSEREKRRMYRRLLMEVPVTDQFTSESLWKSDKWTITKSHWIPRAINQILQDVPDLSVIESTLPTKKIRRL
ncbi:hypothetical protein BDB01DRAFT_789884 [Pilobolus umbonatus]|nr:hypothetical protein BDB01DRAFT_789884 [Pilobolus umbonatus]